MNGKSVTLVFDLLVVIVILAINVSAKGQAEATDINRARARQLWEEALQAKGGRDRLHAVQNFLISGEIQVEAVKGSHTTEVQWLHVLPVRHGCMNTHLSLLFLWTQPSSISNAISV
jgi:hypothetical protein